MDLYQKISILGPEARYDTCGPKDFGQTSDIPGVYHAKVAGNHVCRLFKVLQTNSCVNNCRYCALRRDRSSLRANTTADEMAQAFDNVFRRRLVDGLFLSSAISGNSETTMTKMIDTVSLLRKKHQYRGYVHLKIMPNSSSSTIRQAIRLANRVSLNVEAATEEGLASLSPDKKLKSSLFYTLSLIKKELTKAAYQSRPLPSLTTQFVVGANEEKDKDYIKMSHFLYKNFNFQRIFYSAFRPVEKTPLENKPATSLTREHRLYQADFLLRFYRFSPGEIPLDEKGNLSPLKDPKTLWAEKNPHFFPINLNKAGYWQLIKVPGIGPQSAKKIIKMRKEAKIRSLDKLNNQRIQVNKLAPYVSL